MNNTGGPTRAILAPSESRMMRRLSDQLESMNVMMPSSNENNENPNAFDCSILVSGGERVWVNKMVLARQSLYFYTKFILEARTEIQLPTIRSNVMYSLLEFLHDGQFDTSATDEELLYAANVCQVTNLKDLCEQRLCNSTNESNFVERWKLATDCDAKKLSDKCAQVHLHHQQELQQTLLANLMKNIELETDDHWSYIS